MSTVAVVLLLTVLAFAALSAGYVIFWRKDRSIKRHIGNLYIEMESTTETV